MARAITTSMGMAAGFCFCWLFPLLANANVYTVTTTSDGTAINQLRGAIADADAIGGTSTINVPAGTYILTMGEILFGNNTENITIIGAGAGSTIISTSSSSPDRIFLINPPGTVANVTVTIQGITFTNGVLTSDDFGGGAILCGGPANATNIVNCGFTSNSNDPGNASHGGALAIEGGGTMTISGCTFSNNTITNGDGGAIFYFLPNTEPGSLSISHCTFSGNSVVSANSSGGAISVSIQGTLGSTTSAVSITQNVFLSNHADASGSMGGAIDIDNGFASGNTDLINFNRFYKNTANAIPDLVSHSASGAVDVTNNWWGINAGPLATGDPHVALIGSTGTLVSSPWLELHCSDGSPSVCGGSGGNTETMTGGFLLNSMGATISSSNLGAFVGTPISFSATHGTISGAQATVQSSGTATANFTANITPSPPGTQILANIQAVVDSVSVTDPVAEAQVPIHAPSLATGSTSGSVTASAGDLVITDASCNQICLVVPGGASPVSGIVNASVTVDGSLQTVNGMPYVTRHYDIEPVSGAATATGTITLYFKQSDFDTYNAAVTGAANMLPTGSSDATGKANLTITQYHGTGTVPGNYTGWTGSGPSTVMITPGASNVVWDPTDNWWEVTFNVTGFSGFFITGPVGISLPVVLESFSGQPSSDGVLLTWKVGLETGFARYEVEASTDGLVFGKIGTVAATGAGAYRYLDERVLAGNHFYRLRMVNIDDTYSYSNIVVVKIAEGAGSAVQVLGNPVGATCMLRIVASSPGQVSLRLADMSGKTLWQGSEIVGAGANTIVLPGMDRFAKGMYLLSAEGGQLKETVKVVKE